MPGQIMCRSSWIAVDHARQVGQEQVELDQCGLLGRRSQPAVVKRRLDRPERVSQAAETLANGVDAAFTVRLAAEEITEPAEFETVTE